MGAYIATAGIAGRVGGPGTIRGLIRAGAQREINLTVSVKEDRPSMHMHPMGDHGETLTDF